MRININKAKFIVFIIAATAAIIVLGWALFFIPDNNVNACVRIYTGEGYGSGMVYGISEDEVLIATAAHVLEGYDKNSYVEFANGSSAHALMCSLDDNNDIGILSVPVESIDNKTLNSIKEVDITTDAFVDEPSYLSNDYTDKCIMYDLFQKNGIILFVNGKITSMNEYVYAFDKHMLHGISDKVTEGMSGSPIFDSNGRLLGMLLAGNDAGDFVGITYFNLVNH